MAGIKGPTEKQVEAWIIELYQKVGCIVHKTSQRQRPVGMTVGIPDLIVFCPRRNLMFFHEVKRDGGRQSPGQEAFEIACRQCGVRYVLGGIGTARSILEELGILVAA
jgi:hypothetical protein